MIFVYTWGEALADHRINSAGGLSKKEFRANYAEWDKVGTFSLWQVAWLWTGLRPQDPIVLGTKADPLYQRIEEHIKKGVLKASLDAPVERQTLVDYAHKIGEYPKFLFPERRTLYSRVRHLLAVGRALTPEELANYQNSWTWYEHFRQRIGWDYAAVNAWIEAEIKSGNIDAAGTMQRDGIYYPAFVKIPAAAIRSNFNFYTIEYKGHRYRDIRLKYNQPEASI